MTNAIDEATITFEYYGEDCSVSGTSEDILCLQSLLRNMPKACEKALRDEMAIGAMQGLVSEGEICGNSAEGVATRVAELSYIYADKMLKQREIKADD